VTRVVPVLANNALNHLILDGIFRIRIWSPASAIHTVVVLIVVIVRIVVVLARSEFARGRYSTAICLELEVSAIAPEVTFCIKFDEFVIFVTGVRTGETNPGSKGGILFIGSARDAGVESLPLDVTFIPGAVFRVAVAQNGAGVFFQRLQLAILLVEVIQ